eukprot:2449309-Rhodomonas_salina.1
MKGDEKEQMGVFRGAEHYPALSLARSEGEGGDFNSLLQDMENWLCMEIRLSTGTQIPGYLYSP